jgi:hypothetical protein
MTLDDKVTWLRFAYEKMKVIYPKASSALFRCYTVFKGAKYIKELEAQEAINYKNLKQSKTLPVIYVPVARLPNNNIALLTRADPHYLETETAMPLPLTDLTCDELMDINNAYRVYCTYEYLLRKKGPVYSLLGQEIVKMNTFVDEFINGEYTRLYNHMMSVQLALRVIHKPMTIDFSRFTRFSIQQGNGIRNEYIDMQDRDAVTIPFYNPDPNINLAWVRICVDYKDRGMVELILPDYIAIHLWGEPVQRWHKEYYCPAITETTALQPCYHETSFINLDGCDYPRSLLQRAPEFATLLQIEDQKRQTQEDEMAQLLQKRAKKLEIIKENVQNQMIGLNHIRRIEKTSLLQFF